MFVQTMVSNKFIGHGIVIGVVVLQPILFNFGWENTLYLPGGTPVYTYSDMNGYGHFVPALFWSITYWFAIFALLARDFHCLYAAGCGCVVGVPHASGAAACPAPRAGGGAVPAARRSVPASGTSTMRTCCNEYLTAADRRHILADYERRFKKFENLPQPKITAVEADINIYPERRSFDGTGRFTLQNKSAQPIPEIHLTDQHEAVTARAIRPAVPSGQQRTAAIFIPSMLLNNRWHPARW